LEPEKLHSLCLICKDQGNLDNPLLISCYFDLDYFPDTLSRSPKPQFYLNCCGHLIHRSCQTSIQPLGIKSSCLNSDEQSRLFETFCC